MAEVLTVLGRCVVPGGAGECPGIATPRPPSRRAVAENRPHEQPTAPGKIRCTVTRPHARRAAPPSPTCDAYDNARKESTIGRYKTEVIKPQRPWKTLSHVELATAGWVDWYNHRRLHSETGHVPPAEYEANHYRATTKPQITATI
ncbi:integrase core domain-containing protein [Streptomyces sp. TE5632]